MQTIELGGVTYPAYITMGAFLQYRDLTGEEISSTSAVTDQIKFFYCTVKSACMREKRPFDLSLMEFASMMLPEDLAAFASAQDEGKAAAGGKKKR